MDPSIAAALIQAGGSAISSALGIGATSNLNSRNREWQHNEAVYSRQWQRDENEINRKWQRDMYDYIFNKEANYNNPKAEMERYNAAGLNPYVLMSGSSAPVQSGNVNVNTPSASGTASGAMATSPTTYNPAESMIGFINAFSQAAKNLAEAKLTGANTTRINTLLQGELKQLQLSNDEKSLQNRIFSKYGETEASNRCQYIATQTLRELSQRDLNNITGSLIGEQIENQIKEGKMRDLDLSIKEEQKQYLVDLVAEQLKTQKATTKKVKAEEQSEYHKQRMYDTQSSANMASAFESYKQGNYYDALSQTENLLRDERLQSLKVGNEKTRWESNREMTEFLYEIGSLKDRLRLAEKLPDELQQKIYKLMSDVANGEYHANSRIGGMLQDVRKIGDELTRYIKSGQTWTPIGHY